MIDINLLSPEQKQEIRTKRIYTAIKEAIILALVFSAVISILLLISRYILEDQLADMTSRSSSRLQSSQEINNQIVSANNKIEDIAIIQKNFIKWSNFFYDFSRLTPDQISYKFIKIYYREASMEIEGTAKSRQALLNLKSSMEGSALFSSVDLPLSDILAKENNNFHIKAKINLNQLQQ